MKVGEVYITWKKIFGNCETFPTDMEFGVGVKLRVTKINKREQWVQCADDYDQGKTLWSFNIFEFQRATELLTEVNTKDLQVS